MISKGSCDSEDWNKICIKIEKYLNEINISLYNCFDYFNWINVALLSRKHKNV